ncbi:hypothetical protein AERO9A_250171 [Aeromonas salmonicida]|nr:hypothetical protein AERO9A_250171 [Aeromonas salmonicida]
MSSFVWSIPITMPVCLPVELYRRLYGAELLPFETYSCLRSETCQRIVLGSFKSNQEFPLLRSFFPLLVLMLSGCATTNHGETSVAPERTRFYSPFEPGSESFRGCRDNPFICHPMTQMRTADQ